VVRPRALPLLTGVETTAGLKEVWTTFSADQIDLNYRNPKVLLAMLDVLLSYVHMGADMIRLDAVAYVWKEVSTTCIHLPQAHSIVQLMRAILDEVAPWVALVTETNVPHEDNISYFGDGFNEAQMVYNFSLPPLLLHAFISQDARKLTRWAASLETPSQQTTFFNFLASHDGIGITPAQGILDEREMHTMVEHVQALGGKVSFKNNPDGTKSPYELNINYLDALGNPLEANESIILKARRFLTSQAILLALQGVPGCYFHSLVGSQSWEAGVEQLGHARAINREKLDDKVLRAQLMDSTSLRGLVFEGYQEMLRCRREQPSFHPQGGQSILQLDRRVFALVRSAPQGRQRILCLHNITPEPVELDMDLAAAELDSKSRLENLLGDVVVKINKLTLTAVLDAYESAWLEIIPFSSAS